MDAEYFLPKKLDIEELRKEAEKLRQDVLSGRNTDPVLVKALKKEMGVSTSTYNGEWTLKPDEYIDDIEDQMDLSSGINLINAAVGTGKSTANVRVVDGVKRAVENRIVLFPLNSIRLSFQGDNNVFSTGLCTWNQIESILRHGNKEYFADKTLVIDEVHGFFLDYGYKAPVINRMMAAFPLFKSVVMMSGTANLDDFSGITFNKVYKVNKPSAVKKVINTVVSSHVQDLVLNHIQNTDRKTIVLLNDKAQCEALNSMCTRSGLVVNADKKNDPETLKLYETGILDYEVLYGTYSIVEGLSIENEVDEVEVVIVGDEHPARIEQFTNRFRKVCKLKNVTYFINRKEPEEIGFFSRDLIIKEAKETAKALKSIYDSITDEVFKYSFVSQYRREIAGSFIYFHDGDFHVSYPAIDFAYSEHKSREYANDFNLLSSELKKYDFVVRPVYFDEGDAENARTIRDVAKHIKEDAQEAEQAIIREYLTDRIAGDVKAVEDATELYNSIHESTEKLINRGLRLSDIPALIEGRIEDEAFLYKAHMDASYMPTGNTIRELIITMVNGRDKLDSWAIREIADAVVLKVQNEYFMGNQDLMLKHPEWSKHIDVQQGKTVSSSGSSAKKILCRYIALGKSKTCKVNGLATRLTEVVHLSLTGLHFDIPAFVPKPAEGGHIEQTQTLSTIKARLQALRM